MENVLPTHPEVHEFMCRFAMGLPMMIAGISQAAVARTNFTCNLTQQGQLRAEEASYKRFEKNFPLSEQPDWTANHSADHAPLSIFLSVTGNQHLNQVLNGGLVRMELFQSEADECLRTLFSNISIHNGQECCPKYNSTWLRSHELNEATLDALCSGRSGPLLVLQARLNEKSVSLTYAYRGGTRGSSIPEIRVIGAPIPMKILLGIVDRKWPENLSAAIAKGNAISASAAHDVISSLVGQHGSLKIELLNGNLQAATESLIGLGVPAETIEEWFLPTAGLYRHAAEGLCKLLALVAISISEADLLVRAGKKLEKGSLLESILSELKVDVSAEVRTAVNLAIERLQETRRSAVNQSNSTPMEACMAVCPSCNSSNIRMEESTFVRDFYVCQNIGCSQTGKRFSKKTFAGNALTWAPLALSVVFGLEAGGGNDGGGQSS